MLHRLTAVFDKERTWEKVINIDYLLGFEPHADKDGIYIIFNTTTESFKFHYTNIETMMGDYQTLHTNMSEGFTQTHTIIKPIDFSDKDVILG